MFLKVPEQEIPTTFQSMVFQIIAWGLAFLSKTIAKEEAMKMPLKPLQDPGVQGKNFMSQHLWRTGTTTQIQVGSAGQRGAWLQGYCQGIKQGQDRLRYVRIDGRETAKSTAVITERELETTPQGPLEAIEKEKKPSRPRWKSVTWDISGRQKHKDVFHRGQNLIESG